MSKGCLRDPVARHPQGPSGGTFWGCPRDVRHTGFVNATQKHIKLTLTDYSRLYSKL